MEETQTTHKTEPNALHEPTKLENDPIFRASHLIHECKSMICFTGAGISVESGIPDFRSSGGLWEKFDPRVYAQFSTFKTQPQKFWEMANEMGKILDGAKPNPAHYALSQLEASGKLKAIITQNVDHLHQAAGNKEVYELHGNVKSASCIECKKSYTVDTEVKAMLRTNGIPRCTECNNLVKTDVILFGEPLPSNTLEQAMHLAQECDLIMVIGSLVVSPANLLPQMAKLSGAKLIFINKDPTPMDPLADVVIYGKAGSKQMQTYSNIRKGELLPLIVKELNGML